MMFDTKPTSEILRKEVKVCEQCADNYLDTSGTLGSFCPCCKAVIDFFSTHCSKCKVEETKDNKLFESPLPEYKPWLCMRCLKQHETKT